MKVFTNALPEEDKPFNKVNGKKDISLYCYCEIQEKVKFMCLMQSRTCQN